MPFLKGQSDEVLVSAEGVNSREFQEKVKEAVLEINSLLNKIELCLAGIDPLG